MNDRYRRRESWETRDSLDNMVNRGMDRYRRKAELSGGWKRAGIISGIAVAGIAAIMGLNYLARSGPGGTQTIVEQNNGNVYSGFVVVDRSGEQSYASSAEAEQKREWPGLFPAISNTIESIFLGPWRDSHNDYEVAPLLDMDYSQDKTPGYSQEICGDGRCIGGESSESCLADCGDATCTALTEYCGDAICNNGETSQTCSGDCGYYIEPLLP